MKKNEKIFRCCLCKNWFEGYGNNPWPFGLKETDRCCNDCDSMYVIPTRLYRITREQVLKDFYGIKK